MSFWNRRHDIGTAALPHRSDTLNMTRRTLASSLEEERETALARKVARLPDEQYVRILQRARYYAFNYETPGGHPILYTVAAALAAVEVIEGAPRPMARKRRVVYRPQPPGSAEAGEPPADESDGQRP